MTVYNFKKDSKLYIVKDNVKYSLDVYPDFSLSQTFSETNVPVKTLHTQSNMFENAVITTANPANFSFTIPLYSNLNMDIVTRLLLDYDETSTEVTLKTADLYVESSSEVYKLEKIVLSNGVFSLQREAIITINVSGTARRLSKFTGVIPGVLQVNSTEIEFSVPTALEIKLGNIVRRNISSVSMELRNEIEWVGHTTLQRSLTVNNASDTMYPEAFVVKNRVLSGNFYQYVTDENGETVNSWSTKDSLSIRTGNLGKQWLLEFLLPSVTYTNRLDVQELYSQAYDFRLNSNATNITGIIKINTVPGTLMEYGGLWAAI